MAQRYVKQWGTDKKVLVETEATIGATLGVDLYYNGVLLDPDLILNSAALASTGTSLSTPSVSNKSTASTDFVPEGATNKYATAATIRALVPLLSIPGMDGADGMDGLPIPGTVGATGIGPGPLWLFDTTTGGSPSVGMLSIDTTDISSGSVLSIRTLDNDGLDEASFIFQWGVSTGNPKSYVTLRSETTPARFAVIEIVSSPTLGTPISTAFFQYLSGVTSFAAGEKLRVYFSQVGDNGASGSTGAKGATGANGNPGLDGGDGVDGFTIVGQQGLPGTPGISMLASDGADGYDGIPIVGQTGAAGSVGPGVSNPVCRLTTGSSTNLATLSGSQTVDGLSTAAGDLILLRGQTSASQNGPWVASAGAWTRPTWYASGNTTQAFFGLLFNVTDGTSFGGCRFYIATTGTLTIDTSSVTVSLITMQNAGITQINGVPNAGGGSGWPNSALAAMAANTIKGANTSGNPADLTATQTRAVIGVGGLGTSDAATTAMTASTQVIVPGTKFQLATGLLNVGTVFRFTIGLDKTAAGVATFTVKLCFGTAGTNADAAIATWTSGTNTALADYATLTIDVRITATGATATAAAIAFYSNAATDSTGLGRINPVPGSTATFASTAATPFFHVDITCGAGATMTAWGSAQQLVA